MSKGLAVGRPCDAETLSGWAGGRRAVRSGGGRGRGDRRWDWTKPLASFRLHSKMVDLCLAQSSHFTEEKTESRSGHPGRSGCEQGLGTQVCGISPAENK